MENKQELQVRKKVADTAEPWGICEKLIETGWERQKLWSADYWFFTHDYKKVGITRKEVGDLMNSIGQVFSKQLEEMLDYYEIKIILLEGSWKRVTTGSIVTAHGIQYQTWDMVWNYLRRWQDKGFTLELTTGMGHTIDRLNRLYALYQKPYSLSGVSKGFTDDRIMAMPSGCRGKTGLKVIETLGSLKAVGNANVEQLLVIEDIGEKRASLIFNHFNCTNTTGK